MAGFRCNSRPVVREPISDSDASDGAGARPSRPPRIGIRALLIILLLPGVIALLVIDSLYDYRTLAAITNEAYDSALVEPARVLESSLEFTPEGNLQVATPLYAQVMLESRAGLRKYFRIEEINPPLPDGAPVPTEQGKTLLGMPRCRARPNGRVRMACPFSTTACTATIPCAWWRWCVTCTTRACTGRCW